MRLLIIGTLSGQIGAASKIAIAQGAKVAHVDDIDSGIAALRSGQGSELVMVDVQLDVKSLVDGLARERIHVPIVACGIDADSSAAVRAIECGAKEYIPLPPEPALIAAVLEAVTEESHAIIYRDPVMEEVLALANQVATSDATILISGESGTGKELLARHLHHKSQRANKRFVSVNCAAIPENLLESELFGHEKGAFTGAVARRIGKFEEADGGTLLLDEISEMDVRLQAKLLRVIQEREIDRVGGTQPVKVDIRLIATSNRDLEAEIRKGSFREDLYFRINVVNLAVAPLRERPLDIDILAKHFLRKYSAANKVAERKLSDAARQRLHRHHWRGNVRELENAMHRAVLLAKTEIIDGDAILLSGERDAMISQIADGGGVDAGTDGLRVAQYKALVGKTVAEVERDLILNTLTHCIGNRTHAANILGISIRTLRNKLKLYSQDGTPVPMHGEADSVAL